MSFRFEQTQTQIQKLALTQEMRQSLDLLQYSSEELHAFLQEKQVENPFLKIKIKSSKIQQAKDWVEWTASAESDSIQSSIMDQLLNESLSPECKKAINWLINDFDDFGFLTSTDEEYSKWLGLNITIIKQARQYILQCEPTGIGACSMSQCLLLQAEKGQMDEVVCNILSSYYTLFIEKRWQELGRVSNYSLKQIQQAADAIGTLNPSPIDYLRTPKTEYIISEADVFMENGKLLIRYTKEAFPSVELDEEYVKQIQGDQESLAYINGMKEQVRVIDKQLLQRKETLRLVIQEIVKKQSAFFSKGYDAIVPYTMTELATKLELHESTISRTIKEKYIHTALGTLPLRRFFSQRSTMIKDEDVSVDRVKTQLQQLIQAEDKTKPLSDQTIKSLLEQQGLVLSRRVIAKYREQLGILASTKRKRFE
ncbi:RNA polymerase factor sigma-54 [Viridibacillus arvi]|uniref:RNA polymerase factor sigma-54 n=1 Tax=Viridibacillus arvi TaxID=263475 RepID=UPI0034CDE1E3